MGGNELFITLPYTEFQSTHPVWDGTELMSLVYDMTLISIHPSRVGWDCLTNCTQAQCTHFNPPIPCGMGLSNELYTSAMYAFQSTHPVWDGTSITQMQFVRKAISIHPSRVGWDPMCAWRSTVTNHFNPPIPCGMGLGCRLARIPDEDISIHPSRVGWDPGTGVCNSNCADFNPPIPCGMGLE